MYWFDNSKIENFNFCYKSDCDRLLFVWFISCVWYSFSYIFVQLLHHLKTLFIAEMGPLPMGLLVPFTHLSSLNLSGNHLVNISLQILDPVTSLEVSQSYPITNDFSFTRTSRYPCGCVCVRIFAVIVCVLFVLFDISDVYYKDGYLDMLWYTTVLSGMWVHTHNIEIANVWILKG